ncbi:MAG: histidinol-phosphate transaminase [Desulfitobacteriaceae bacterium]
MTKASELIREEILTLTPYIPGRHIKAVEAELGITGIIKMASNENPLGPSPKAAEAAAVAVSECNFYPDPNCTYLREELAQYWQVAQDNLVFGNGAHELIFLITSTFLNPGEEAVIPLPSFGEYVSAVKLAGGVVKAIPLQDHTTDLEACLKAITPKTKLVYICNPNNPTGTIVEASKLRDFMERVPDNVLVIYDEAYGEYIDDTSYPKGIDWVKAGKNVIVLRTFSKAYSLAGLRVGYALATSELAGYVARVRQVFNVDSVAQAAAVAALNDTEYTRHSLASNKAGREYLYRALTEMGLEYVPTQANFILVNVKEDSNKVFQELMKLGVIVRPASIFGLPEFLRVSIGTLEQNQKFIRALSQLVPGVA